MIGFYGDDFTGSVDALWQFRRAGLTGELVTDPADVGSVTADVVGVAGHARSLRTHELEAHVRPALEALREVGCDVVLYKVCSTADSSPEVGSIGRAVEVGRSVLGERPVPFLAAQPDFGRWTVFGTHFAAENGAVYRLDRQPTMSRHPATPMREADLRTHLQAQTSLTVGGVDRREYGLGAEHVSRLVADGEDLVVLDALTDDDLTVVGRVVALLPRPCFVVGSGGLALALGRAVGGSAEPLATQAAPAAGPVLVVSGSCSPTSWAQAQAALSAGWVGVSALDEDAPARAAAACAAGRDVVAYTSSGRADTVTPPELLTARLASVVRAVASSGPISRLVVAGGDTSGVLLRLLGARSLRIVAAPWGNLPLLRVSGGELDGTAVVLKGGQVGARDAYLQVAGRTPA